MIMVHSECALQIKRHWKSQRSIAEHVICNSLRPKTELGHFSTHSAIADTGRLNNSPKGDRP